MAPTVITNRHSQSEPSGSCALAAERGISLLETVVALGLLLVVAAGVLPLGVFAIKTTENQGHLTARATDYAQDKLEQLLALAYGDSVTDTRTFPAAAGGGSGLGNAACLGAVCGSADPDAPVDLYVDYLRLNGDLIPAGAGEPDDWYYKRVWSITSPRDNLKQITVTAIVRQAAMGGVGGVPQATVSALKTAPF